jgi:hypothetical protein
MCLEIITIQKYRAPAQQSRGSDSIEKLAAATAYDSNYGLWHFCEDNLHFCYEEHFVDMRDQLFEQ